MKKLLSLLFICLLALPAASQDTMSTDSVLFHDGSTVIALERFHIDKELARIEVSGLNAYLFSLSEVIALSGGDTIARPHYLLARQEIAWPWPLFYGRAQMTTDYYAVVDSTVNQLEVNRAPILSPTATINWMLTIMFCVAFFGMVYEIWSLWYKRPPTHPQGIFIGAYACLGLIAGFLVSIAGGSLGTTYADDRMGVFLGVAMGMVVGVVIAARLVSLYGPKQSHHTIPTVLAIALPVGQSGYVAATTGLDEAIVLSLYWLALALILFILRLIFRKRPSLKPATI